MHSQFSNCSLGVDLKKINLAFCGTGAVCSLISALIVLLILICRAYYTVLQRLFLYLMVGILLRELFITASFEHQYEYNQEMQDRVCVAIGFIWNWTGILVFIFTVGMKVYLYFYVKRLTRGETGLVFVHSSYGRAILESLYVVLSVIVAVCYSFVPYFMKNYGLAGAWCWIRAIDKNCTVRKSGMINQIMNGYIFYISGSVIGLILLIAISVLYCRLPRIRSNDVARMLLKKTFFVIITFVANIIITAFALLTRVTAGVEKHYKFPGTWYSFAVTYPISLLLFPVVYMICFFRVNHVSSCFRKLRPPERVMRYYTTSKNPTNQKSTRVSASSETFFEVPHSNSFNTEISDNKPLITEIALHKDVEYGSVTNKKYKLNNYT